MSLLLFFSLSAVSQPAVFNWQNLFQAPAMNKF